MRDGLCGIDKHERSGPMGAFANFPGGIDPTEDVRNVGESHQLGSFGKERVQLIESQAAIVADVERSQCRVHPPRGQLPRYQI